MVASTKWLEMSSNLMIRIQMEFSIEMRSVQQSLVKVDPETTAIEFGPALT